MNTTEMIEFDKATIMSDGIMRAVLEVEAESIGVTIEEYVNKLLEIIYRNPQKLYSVFKLSAK